ncbi:MAG: alpha/beta hydrolase [Candidatus Margulisbacteria bacterium]|jgi:pimeloyl-ACP methyl ester carboxylesterase|nr:alpha/beta hydrolase [Candidatus Margulisiibacteriota bacterium]
MICTAVISTPAAKLPLIFIPGWNIRAEIFRPFAAYFSAYKLYYFTPPRSAEGDAYAQAVAALGAYIKEQAITRPLLLGWSMGGQLALLAARTFPVAAVVLVSSAAVFSRRAAEKKSFAAACARDFPRAVSHFQSLMGGDPALLQKYFIQDQASALNYLRSLHESDLSDTARQGAYTLGIVHARGDKVIPFGAAAELRRLRPDAKLLALDGNFHFPFAACCDKIICLLERVVRGWCDEKIQIKRCSRTQSVRKLF